MSLQGSLRQLGLADVLQTALAGREGNLILRRGAVRAVLHVATNQIHLVEPDPIDPDVLLEGFVHRGLLAADTLAAERGNRNDPLEVLDALLDGGVLPWSEVDAVLRGTAEDAILDLLTWQDGDFRFDEGEEAPDREGLVGRVGVDIGGMLLRAAQRLDEHNVIAEELGLEALLFIPMDAPPPVDYEGDPTPTVHALLDGRRVIDEVAMLCGLTRFSVLRSVFACVRCGAARTPSTQDLAEQVNERIEADQLKVARALLLQWASLAPGDEEPLLRLADLAKRRQSPEEHADALQALGHLRLRQGHAAEAQDTFRTLLELRPGDELALEALCQAAEAAGDSSQVQHGTIELARTALEADDAERAAALLEDMTRSPEAPMNARVIRGRALIRLKLRDALILEAETAAQALGQRARHRDEKLAAIFFRDAIATLAPERSDLLRRFRSLVDRPKTLARNASVVVALLAVLGTVGFFLRPEGAGEMLARIESAYTAGNDPMAQQLIAELARLHPDAPETDRAFRLQSENTIKRTDTRLLLSKQDRDLLDQRVRSVEDALASFPDPGSLPALFALQDLLLRGEYHDVQKKTLQGLGTDISKALSKVEKAVRARRDFLARSATLARGSAELHVLRDYIPKAQAYFEDEFAEEIESGERTLSKLVGLHAGERVQSALRKLRSSLPLYRQALEEYAASLVSCRRSLAEREIEEAYDLCRVQAVKYLTNARLDDAESYYRTLEGLVARLESDVELAPVRERIEGRRYGEFLQEKLSVIADIRAGLTAAARAEEDDDVDRAVRIYVDLAERYWLIRLEDIIAMPMRITTVPTGVRVQVGDAPPRRTPCVIHYHWARQQTLTLSAPGFKTVKRFVGSQRIAPSSTLEIEMTPARRWTVPIDEGVIRPPVALGKDLLLGARGGRLTRIAGRDGQTLWARHVRTLEGTRAVPVLTDDEIALVFLDGRLVYFDPETGSPELEAVTARPSGDPAFVEDVILIPTLDGRIAGYRGGRQVLDLDVGQRPTAGLLLAHQQAWVGLSNGDLARIDRTGEIRRLTLPGRATEVSALAAYEGGVLATKSDGLLVCLAPDGEVRWSVKELGDLDGKPAVAGGVAAIADSRGRVLLFRLDDGHPLGQITLGEPTVGGIQRTDQEDFLALLADGTLWVYDPAKGVERVRSNLEGSAVFPPLLLPDNLVAVAADGRHLALVELPPKTGKAGRN